MTEQDLVKLTYIVQDYDRLEALVADLDQRLARVESIDSRRSSIEVGTPAKGGAIKLYFDPFAESEVNDAALAEAVRLLEKAGGVPNGNRA